MNFPNYFFPHKHPQVLFLPIPSKQHEEDGNRAARAGAVAQRAARDAPAEGKISVSHHPCTSGTCGAAFGAGQGDFSPGPPARDGLQPGWGPLSQLSPIQFCDPPGEITALSPAPAGGRGASASRRSSIHHGGQGHPESWEHIHHLGAWVVCDPSAASRRRLG